MTSWLGNKRDEICCYKCTATKQLLVEEKVDNETGKVIEKNFICTHCAGGIEKIINQNKETK